MYILILLLLSLLYYLPIIVNPDILLNRGNDLSEFFFPIFHFVKNTLIEHHQLPLWNNLFFSGTPLLPDPQSPLFYLPNIIFLFTDIDKGFLLTIFLHIFLSSVSMYFLCKNGFKFSKNTSLICSLLYISSPKLSSYIEAGHYGLILSWLFIPLVILSIINLAKKTSLKNTVYFAVSLSSIFYLHILIFLIMAMSSFILYFYLILQKKYFIKHTSYFIISTILCFGFCAITLLPQLNWQKETTRNLLLNNPEVYPNWLGYKEFITSAISPILQGPQFIQQLDTEKMISIGFFPGILTFLGFLKVNKKNKFIFLLLSIPILLLSLNNISPIHETLIQQNWYILFRVSTRYWFLIIIICLFLIGVAIKSLHTKKNFLFYIIIFLSISESLLISWTKILKPIKQNPDLANQAVYQFISSDKNKFRIFCLERCLSQKTSALYQLELADGYGTLQQLNYYQYSQQLSQSFYRNRYTLSIPPFEIYKYEELQPYSPNLSAYNIKYVISNHELKDKNLIYTKKFDNYIIYENSINLDRSNYPITFYSPNQIRINTSSFTNDSIILSEVYNPDWKAYLNGTDEKQIEETADKTRQVKITTATKFVDFIYKPKYFLIGTVITLVTITTSVILFIFDLFKNKKKNTES